MDHSENWKIIEKLGEGGQGKVYRVIDKKLDLGTQAEMTDVLIILPQM